MTDRRQRKPETPRIQRTLVLLKPDAIEQGREETIVSEMAHAGIHVLTRKEVRLTIRMTAEHYEHHIKKDFFDLICRYMMRRPVVAMIVQGPGVIEHVRRLAGDTDPRKADPTTWRGRWGKVTNENFENVIHASGNVREAAMEIARFFPEAVVYAPLA